MKNNGGDVWVLVPPGLVDAMLVAVDELARQIDPEGLSPIESRRLAEVPILQRGLNAVTDK